MSGNLSNPWINVSGLPLSGKISFLPFLRQKIDKRASRFLLLSLKVKLESLSVATQYIHRPQSNNILLNTEFHTLVLRKRQALFAMYGCYIKRNQGSLV